MTNSTVAETYLAGFRHGQAEESTLALLLCTALVEHLEGLHGSSGSEAVGVVVAAVVAVGVLVLVDGV